MGVLTTSWRRVLAWFQDDIFQNLFLNAGKLLSANGFSAILGFIISVLTARALGTENYGVLALVFSYEATIGKLITFKTWQVIIRYGSEALHTNDHTALRQLIKFGFSLDIGSAIVGTVLAMALAEPVINLIGWDESTQPLLMLYSTLILFGLSGTSIGVLRLFDRFDLLSYTAVINVLVRLGGVGWCLWTGQGLFGFVFVYLLTGIVGMLYQFLAALWVLRSRGIGDIVRQPMHGVRDCFPGIWDYVWTANLNSTIRMISREADGLIIAGLTTPAALGLFRVAKQFSMVLPMLSDPLSQSIYPELTRLWAKGEKQGFVSLAKRVTLFTSAASILVWLMFVIFGRWLILLTFGPDFVDAYLVAVFYMLALVVFLCSFAIMPMMLSVGLVRQSFFSILIATSVYFLLLLIIVPSYGVVGASLAYLSYFVFDQGIKGFLLLSHLRRAA